jgi:hypothetical protein
MPNRTRRSTRAVDAVMHTAIGFAVEEKLRAQTRAGARFMAIALAVLTITVAISAWFLRAALDDLHTDHALVQRMAPQLDDVQHRIERIENMFLNRSISGVNNSSASQGAVPICDVGAGCGGYFRSRPSSRGIRLARQPDAGIEIEGSGSGLGLHDAVAGDAHDGGAEGRAALRDRALTEVR